VSGIRAARFGTGVTNLERAMIAEIAGGLTALKSASDLSKAMMDLRDTAEFQTKSIELQRQILAAQESALAANERHTALLEQIKLLEAEIAHLKKWEAEKSAYNMKNLGSGSFAYMSSQASEARAADHWLCVKCFDEGKRGVLQNQGRTKDGNHSIYGCPICKNTLQVHWNTYPGAIRPAQDKPTA
jgi:hypothetical protein